MRFFRIYRQNISNLHTFTGSEGVYGLTFSLIVYVGFFCMHVVYHLSLVYAGENSSL